MKTLRALSVSVLLVVGWVQIRLEAQQAQQSESQPGAPQQGAAQQGAGQPDAPQPPATPPSGTPPPATGSSSSSSSSAPAAPSERRFSGGIIGSYLGFGQVPGRTFTDDNTVAITTQYQTTGAGDHIGYGLTVQSRIINHFYLNVSGILRQMGYQETTTVSTTTIQVLNGSTFPSTSTTSTHEDTRARLIDIPFLLRYYGTPKRPRSPRWFLELGGTYRFADQIRTSLDSTDAIGDVTCCTTTATVPKHHSAIGETVGAGITFTDEFGIKVTPEFRYTRWAEPIFESLSTTGRANQIEAVISFTF